MPFAPAQTVNHWHDDACARAFWKQHETPAYQQLLADTLAWLDPGAGERWLDLGCGCGPLMRGLWLRSGGTVAEIVGVDCAAINARAIRQMAQDLGPEAEQRLRFVPADFSKALPFPDCGTFDGVVSGLAIQYAESYCPEQQRWTTAAYDRLLAEIHRLLRPGGRLVFSVNVPNPSWGRVALASLTGVLQAPRPLRYVQKSWRMLRYGRWLKHQARLGRFHYLEASLIADKLRQTGFAAIAHRRSFVGQAYLFRCLRP